MLRPETDRIAPLLTPHGQVLASDDPDAPSLAADLRERLIDAFSLGPGHGLFQLGASEVGTSLPSAWGWWRDFAACYVTALCAATDGDEIVVPLPDEPSLDTMLAGAPPMSGAEYLTRDVLTALWYAMDAAVRAALASSNDTLQAFLKAHNPAWNQVGRVHFNLAENRKDADAPFAFLATYTTGLSELLFRLRNVDAADLVAQASAGLTPRQKRPTSARVLDDAQLADVFDIEIAAGPAQPMAGTPRKKAASKTMTKTALGAVAMSPRKTRASPKLAGAAKTPATKSSKAGPIRVARHQAGAPLTPPSRGKKASTEPAAAALRMVARKPAVTGSLTAAKQANTGAKKGVAAKPVNLRPLSNGIKKFTFP